jgi:ABC-type sugar transport system ATPase subunit
MSAPQATSTRDPVPSSATSLVTEGLSKRYPGVLALDRVDVEIHGGQVLGLLGKNGAGKSTLIKVLAGAVTPDAGRILLDGEEVEIGHPHRATEMGIAVVHQELLDVPNLSVAENVELGLGYPRSAGVLVNRRALRRRTREALELLEADISPRATVGELGPAQRRLVMIARGLAAEARVLILDEPSASLTETEIEHLHRVVRTLQGRGVAVVYVTHRLDEVFQVTDQVTVMRDGRVVHRGPTAELTQQSLIRHITGTAVVADEDRKGEVPPPAPDAEELLGVEGISLDGVVEDVSFKVRRGDMLGIAGLVGSGRTELTRLIYGADRASAGRVTVGGEEVRIRSPRDALGAGIVLLPEDRKGQGNITNFSVRKNITLPQLRRHRSRRWLPMPRRRDERRYARSVIERVSIKVADEEAPVKNLSGGNQQKVMLAKWLDSDAEVFIFDEPTHGVDVEGKEETYKLMEALAKAGKGVIFISSEFSELVGTCNRVLVMREGRLVGELKAEAINDTEIVERCYAT